MKPDDTSETMKQPTTPTEWAAYRAILNCQIGIQAIDGTKEPPRGVSYVDYALYNLLHAVKSLAEIHFNPEHPKP
jgi:hypothetical protein